MAHKNLIGGEWRGSDDVMEVRFPMTAAWLAPFRWRAPPIWTTRWRRQ